MKQLRKLAALTMSFMIAVTSVPFELLASTENAVGVSGQDVFASGENGSIGLEASAEGVEAQPVILSGEKQQAGNAQIENAQADDFSDGNGLIENDVQGTEFGMSEDLTLTPGQDAAASDEELVLERDTAASDEELVLEQDAVTPDEELILEQNSIMPGEELPPGQDYVTLEEELPAETPEDLENSISAVQDEMQDIFSEDGFAAGGEETFTEGDYTYVTFTLDGQETPIAVITKYTGSESEIIIPDMLGGYVVAGIGMNVFSGCTFLRSIELPDSVIALEDYAFSGCTSLERVELSDNLLYLGSYAFSGCTSLRNIEMSGSVIVLYGYTFEGCTSLETVKLSDSLSEIWAGAFSDCISLRSIELPAGVTSLRDGVFRGCTSLENVKLSDNLTNIGFSTFRDCESLRSIELPNSVISLGNYAFSGCTSLETVKLSDSVTSLEDSAFSGISLAEGKSSASLTNIGDSAFSGCELLKSVELPDGVTSLGDYVFSECRSLETVKLPAGLTNIGNHAFWFCGLLRSIELPDSVTSLGDCAFDACELLETVKLSTSLTTIGSSAFRDCKSLRSIELPDSVTSLGDSAFSGCSALETVKLSTGLNNIGYDAFCSCKSLRSIELPAGVTSVGGYAFDGCTSLETVKLSTSLTTIGSSAFRDCKLLGSIELPDSVTSLEDYAFYECELLETVKLPDSLTNIGNWAFEYCESLRSIELPDSVTSLGNGAFSGCSALERVKLPAGLTNIGGSAFYGCKSLRSIELPDSITSLGEYVFMACSALERVKLPVSLTNIGTSAFEGCESLRSIELPDSITIMGGSVFGRCTSLETVKLPPNLKGIYGTFGGCTSLRSIELPGSLTNIGISAFYGCTSLERVELPDSLTNIENSAFYGCELLGSIELPDSVTSLGDSAFRGCTSLERVKLPDSLTNIENYAFSGCTSLERVELPDSVTSLGDSAFRGCTSLERVELSVSLTNIGNSAFNGCELLGSIELPDSVTSLGDSAFRGCTSLERVELSDSLTNIGNSAFSGCTSLERVKLPDSLTNIENYAFSGCTSLRSIEIPDSVVSISYSAFGYCQNLIFIANMDSYAYGYALKHNIPCTPLFIETELVVDAAKIADWQAYKGMRLIAAGSSGVRIIKRITENTEYSFLGFDAGDKCSVTIQNSRGSVLAEIGDITIAMGENRVELTDAVPIREVSVAVQDEKGNDVSSQVTVEWLRDGETYDSGTVISGVPVGEELTCRVTPGKTLGPVYAAPEDMQWTVIEEENHITVVLSPFGKIRLCGMVEEATAEKKAIAGASVTVTQLMNGKYEVRTTAVTDARGAFSMEIYAGAATAVVSSAGYKRQELSPGSFTEDTDLGEILLETLDGAKISLKGTYTYASVESETAQTRKILSWDGMDFEVYNETLGVKLGNTVLEDNTLVLPEGISAGDSLRITASDRTETFSDASCTVVMGENLRASAALELTQKGSVRASFMETENENVCMLVYASDGELVWSGLMAADFSLQSDVLSPGAYTVVLMGESKYLPYPAKLSEFDSAGLVEGTDYVLDSADVADGRITPLFFELVPLFDEENFCYTDVSQTVFAASRMQVTAGSYLTLRAKTAFKQEYAERVSDVKWVYELSGDCEYIAGTTAGFPSTETEVEDRKITVPVSDVSDLVRICVAPTQAGTWRADAYLEFTLDGKLIRQSVGNVQISVDGLTFTMSSQTNDTVVHASGTAPANSAVYIYDNEVSVGQTTTGETGIWALDFSLHKPYTYSKHKIYAEIIINNQLSMRTQTRELLYIYTENPVKVSRVTMINCGSGNQNTVFDFINPQQSGSLAYTYNPSYPSFTFLVDFKGERESLEKISNVQLEVICSDGKTRTLYPEWNEGKGSWITCGDFYSNSLPATVRVSYDFDTDVTASREEQAENEAQWKMLIESFGAQWEKTSFDDLDLDEDDPDGTLKAAIEEYVSAQEETQLACENYIETAENIAGSVDGQENCVKISSEYADITVDKSENAVMTPSELERQDYEKMASTSGDGVYVKLEENGGINYVDPQAGLNATVQFDSSTSISQMQGSLETKLQEIADAFEKPVNGLIVFGDSANKVSDEIDAVLESKNARLEEIKTVKKEASQTHANLSAERDSLVKYHDSLMEQEDFIEAENVRKSIAEKEKEIENCQKQINDADGAIRKQNEDIVRYERKKALISEQGKIGKGILKGLSILNVMGTVKDLIELTRKMTELDDIYKSVTPPGCETCKEAGEGCLAESIWLGAFITYKLGILAYDTVSMCSKAVPHGWLLVSMDIAIGVTDCFFTAWYRENLEKKLSELYRLSVLGLKICREDESGDSNKRTPRYTDDYTGKKKSGNIDPSGYVYEAVASNRLEDVTVTALQKVTKYDIYGEAYEEIQVWDASEHDQENPAVTDSQGQYAWDVPAGIWQVKYEKEGYETAYSQWLDVPPPHYDVNIGLVSYEEPEVTAVRAYTDGVEITFSKYMRTSTLLASAIHVLADGEEVSGRIRFLNEEANPEKAGEKFASKILFLPSSELTEGEQITVRVDRSVSSYAKVRLEKTYEETAEVLVRLESLQATEELVLSYGGSGVIELEAQPAGAAAGRKVSVGTQASLLFETDEDTVTLDENGKAQIHVKALLPGSGGITFSMDDMEIAAETKVTVNLPVKVHSVSLDKTELSFHSVGQTEKLTALVLPENAANQKVTFKSSNTEAAVVAEDGLVTAVGNGEAVITVTTEDGAWTAACHVTVKILSPCEAAGHHTYKETIVQPTCTTGGYTVHTCILCGSTYTDLATAALGHTGGTAACTSPAVCTRCGKTYKAALGHSFGAWKVTAQATVFAAKQQTRTCQRCGAEEKRNTGSALKPVLTLTANSLVMKTGQSTKSFKVTKMAKGDYVTSVKSGNGKLLKVSNVKKTGTFKLTAQKKTGTAKLTIKLASGKSKTIKVKIQKAKVKTTAIKGVSKSLSVKKGKKIQLKPVLSPVTSQDKITYSTANKKTATVSSKGVIKGIKKGTTKITVKAGTKKYVCTVKVK